MCIDKVANCWQREDEDKPAEFEKFFKTSHRKSATVSRKKSNRF
jgi:hypothetical protein